MITNVLRSVTQQPKAESHGEETIGECPTCHGKGEINKEGEQSIPIEKTRI